MTFIARIKQHSQVWRLWSTAARIGGALHGAVFRWEPGNVYRTGALTQEQVIALGKHPSVTLEVAGGVQAVNGAKVLPEAILEPAPVKQAPDATQRPVVEPPPKPRWTPPPNNRAKSARPW